MHTYYTMPEPVQLPDNRKTPEQLAKELDELDNLKDDELDDTDPEDEEDPEAKPNAEESEDEDDDPEDPQPKTTPPAEDPNKQKLDNSLRGAELLKQQNDHYKDTLKKASEINEVTDQEVQDYAKGKGFDWDELDDNTKNIIKDNALNAKRFSVINDGVKEDTQINEYREKVDEFVDADDTVKQFPRLEGKEDAFKKFAMKPSRRTMDLEDIAILFLAQNPEAPKKKGSLFLNGSGGGENTKGKAPKMTETDLRRLRINSPKEYNRLARAGKLPDPLEDL